MAPPAPQRSEGERQERQVPGTRPRLLLAVMALLVLLAAGIYTFDHHCGGERLAYPPGLTLRDEAAALAPDAGEFTPASPR
jgi:hypothetical protein